MTVTVGTGVVGCNNDPESESVARRIETVGWLVGVVVMGGRRDEKTRHG